MSKYVPPFLKSNDSVQETKSETKEAWRRREFSHPEPSRYPEPSRNNQETKVTLVSGTMASLTKAQSSSTSYSSRFAEQERIKNNPNYVPPQKPVNISSEDDFPTLGVPKVPILAVPKVATSGQTLIQMAEGWGKKIKEDDEANRRRIQTDEDERRRIAKENCLKEKYGDDKQKIVGKNKSIIKARKNEYYVKEIGAYKPIVDNTLEEDSVESCPSHEEEEEDDDESQEDEFNTNIGYERRHRDELY